ncbi:SDR family oxidoreductase [Nostocaceae cyanobacterium CENA357]|uniref:SDR family oxidoreductase n=1 Tax=Atlanticothrix silvestris CENA357 TaxID=1725252 RepID=A0A8J7L582_9CYAN|nr:SDR family oxidoreductase [Atlanticothrix silvestris]MBH8554372.1 SDR family oxidoreductase [Atlanticothrix silvestris CENA357]
MNQEEKKRLVVIGASRGIGAAVAKHFSSRGHEIFSVSRSTPAAGTWIKADVSNPNGIAAVKEGIGTESVDALLFMGGVWEGGAFTDDYDFLKSSDQETRFVISVNMIAPIEITRKLSENLVKGKNPRAIYIGSVSGLDNCASAEVANTASKFGLRGAVQSLRLAFRDKKIGFTVINPGNVATDEVMLDIKEGRFPPQTPIPLSDIISSIEWILSLSSDVDVQDLNLHQR